jgi:formylglycine-generating enzyme required for sulfatase activity
VIALALGVALYAQAHAQRTATATASVVKGFVVAISVTDGGSGYSASPDVTIIGGGGSEAAAVATVVNGVVTEIRVTSAGSGYSSVPDVIIGAPQVAQLTVLELAMVPRLTFYGAVGSTNEIQYVTAFGDTNHWLMLTNLVLSESPQAWYDTVSPPGSQRYYQAVVLGTGPLPPTPPGFVWIAPGRFVMGSPDNEQDRYSNEGPQTVVTLTHGFFICQHEVTQGEYQAVMGSNPSYFQGVPNRPVEQVSWYDAIAFCMKYTEQERAAGRLAQGWVYRLPTEAEWEYACRAGTTNRFSFGDDPGYTKFGDRAWYSANCGGQTHVVGLKLPNGWGLYDMYGNVDEWCLDWYGGYPGGSVSDPKGPDWGSARVIRSGSFGYVGGDCRSADRSSYWPDGRLVDIGFRAVMAYAPDGFFGEPARITQAPVSQQVLAGVSAVFTVQAAGRAPLSYQWYKDGAKLVASARVSGVDAATLTIANVAEEDVGAYTVEVWNDWGLETSPPAGLSLGVPGFVWIPPGTFTMGSPSGEQDRDSGEGPETVVTLTRGFWLGRYEVTQAEYESVMGSNPSYWKEATRPVEQMSWYDATNYCGKLTEREWQAGRLPTGYVYRLPTEAEWEYACRAGTTTRFSYGDDLTYANLTNYAWYTVNSGNQTHPVGQKTPNPWGIYDMHGNVWEWCQDYYNTYPGGSVVDPQGPAIGTNHVLRGGSWYNIPSSMLRSAFRRGDHLPTSRDWRIGFRVVLAPGQP